MEVLNVVKFHFDEEWVDVTEFENNFTRLKIDFEPAKANAHVHGSCFCSIFPSCLEYAKNVIHQ